MNEPFLTEASAMSPAEVIDREHLRLLAIFHYLAGVLTILFSSIFLIHVAMGLTLALRPDTFPRPNGPGGMPPEFPPMMGILIAIFAGGFVLAGWLAGGLTIYSGRCLARHRHRLFSLILAGIHCLFAPFGTVLGVCTIVVLLRDSVRRLYAEPI